jgi:formimidoylglutamate deiminase
MMKHLAPDYLYTEQGLQADRVLSLTDDGRIDAISRPETLEEQGVDLVREVERLPGLALLPGFVNTHSHVFQRALRGHTHRPLSQDDTFWTWRRAMYAEAERLDPASLYEIALSTYREMLASGYTTVGEFHYVHHQPGGQPYADANAMAQAIVQAGQEAGIRVVLLMAAYAQGDIQRAIEEKQRRFCDHSVEAYLTRVERLRVAGVPVGLAPHSVRAVPQDWLRVIADYSRTYRLPLHIHADEQLAEIEQCRAAYGCTPVELLEKNRVLSERTTIVHATHAAEEELTLLAQTGCTVCVCPTTEGDLGDGIAPYARLIEKQIPLAIGSDSNTRLDPLEEMRWMEYTARMRYQKRRILVGDEMASPGPYLLKVATINGAKALGVKSGVLAPGLQADYVAVNLKHPTLAGWSEQDLLDGLIFGASSEVIVQTWVQGRRPGE